MKTQIRKKLLTAQIELLTAKAAGLPEGPYKRLIEAQAELTELRLQELSESAELPGKVVDGLCN